MHSVLGKVKLIIGAFNARIRASEKILMLGKIRQSKKTP